LFWWVLVAIIVAIPSLLFVLYYWLSKDPGVEREISKESFRAEQELRWLRRFQGSTDASIRDSSKSKTDGERFAKP
jgi:hypothetical protein